MAGVSRILAVYLCLLVALPATLGVYVYKDAKKRRMNAVLWALAAALIPVFIGFAIYLIVRKNEEDTEWECPVCKNAVSPAYAVCPSCGAKLRKICRECRKPVEEGWSVCPSCGAAISREEEEQVTPPVHRKDKALCSVLAAALAVPAVFLVLLVFFMLDFARPGTNFVSFSQSTSYTEEDMERYMEEQPQIRDWLLKCQEKSPDGVYVLRYRGKMDKEKLSAYLIYRPSAGNMKKVEQTTKDGRNMEVTFEDTDNPRWSHAYYPMSYFSSVSGSYMGLQIFVNGEQRDYEMEDIEFDPAL